MADHTTGAEGGIAFEKPSRDPTLRKAALDADRAFSRWQGSCTDEDYDGFCKAMDALREELAK